MKKLILYICLLLCVSMPVYSAPGYHQGFARGASESANPGLWDSVEFLFFPELGNTGTQLHGVSGSKLTASFNNMDGTNWSRDRFGNCLSYNNVDEWLEFTPIGIPDTNHCTMIVAINPTARGAFDGIMMGRGADFQGIIFGGASGVPLGYYWEGVSNEWNLASGIQPALGERSLIALVISPTKAIHYMCSEDGTFSVGNANTKPHNAKDLNKTWNIGRDPSDSASRYVNGFIAGASLFSKSFTEGEVRDLFKDWLGMFRLKRQEGLRVPDVAPAGRRIMLISQYINNLVEQCYKYN